MNPTQNSSPNIFNKITLFSGKISFILALVSGIFLYLRVDEHGYDNPISASLLGSLFFCIFMGVLLTLIGRCNLPNFKLDASQGEN